MELTQKWWFYCEKVAGGLLRRSFKAYIIESSLQIENPYIKQRRITDPPQRMAVRSSAAT